jgi:O-antigen/teichoic acid export membrane protein
MGSGAIKVLSVGLVFLTGVFLSRSMGPESYGIYTYAYTIVILTSLAISGGLSTLLLRAVAQYQLKEEWCYINGIKKRANQLVVIGSVFLSVILIAYIVNITDPVVKSTHYFSLFVIPILSLSVVRTSVLRGFNQPILAQLADDIIRPGMFLALLVVGFYMSKLTPVVAMAMYAASSLAALIAGFYFLKKNTPVRIQKAKIDYQNHKWIKQMLPFTLIAVIQMLNSQLDVLMLGSMMTHADVGLYQVAAQIVILIGFPLLIINYVLTSKFAQHFMANELNIVQQLVDGATKIILVISIPVVIFFIALGEHFVDVVFGKAYLNSYAPLLILMVGQVVNAWIGSVGVLLNMAGYEMLAAKGLGVSLLANFSLNYYLIPSMGVNGAAIATSFTLVIWNLYMAKILWQKKKIKAGVFGLLMPDKRVTR